SPASRCGAASRRRRRVDPPQAGWYDAPPLERGHPDFKPRGGSGAPDPGCRALTRHKNIIAGAGGMGSATGLLLKELGDFEVDLFLGDSQPERAQAAARWIQEGSDRPGSVTAFPLPPNGTSPEVDALLERADILLDCLPGEQAPRMARLARRHNL